MGLDNGIVIRSYSEEMKKDFLPQWINHYGDREWIEVIYSRKWWGVRNDIVKYLATRYNDNDNAGEQYEWELTTTDVYEIRDILVEWCDKRQWEEEGGSTIWLWELDDIASQIGNMIASLNHLIGLMIRYPKLTVYFYDSY